MSTQRSELGKIVRCFEISVEKGLRSQKTNAKVLVPARIAIPMLYLVLWAVDGLRAQPSQWNSHFQDLFEDLGFSASSTSLVREKLTEWIEQVLVTDFTSLYLVGLEAKAEYRELPDGHFRLDSNLLMSMLKVAIDQAKTLKRVTLFTQVRLRFWMDK